MGGHDGAIALFIKKNFKVKNIYIIEFHEKIQNLELNKELLTFYQNHNIFYYKSIDEIENQKTNIFNFFWFNELY